MLANKHSRIVMKMKFLVAVLLLSCVVSISLFVSLLPRLKTTEQKLHEILQHQQALNQSISEFWIPRPEWRIEDYNLTVYLGEHLEPWKNVDTRPLECKFNITFDDYWFRKTGERWPIDNLFDRFFVQINSCELYSNSSLIQEVLDFVATARITDSYSKSGGTQVKLKLRFGSGMYALVKPQRFNRSYVIDPNHFIFSDFERHNAEIAAFHLSKTLGLRHTVPTVGRNLNLKEEIRATAEKRLNKTFFYSMYNLCFTGICDYYCDHEHPICGTPIMREASFQILLPRSEMDIEHKRSPYRRTYSVSRHFADWQTDPEYCNKEVKPVEPFRKGRKLLDLVEMYIFDYLQDNQDRHHYQPMSFFDEGDGREGPFAYLDNGRAFRGWEDDNDILAPLSQCCVIRPSFLKTLYGYFTGNETLSQAFYQSMDTDPLQPVLHPNHFIAIERRLYKVLMTVRDCIEKNDGNADKVIITEFAYDGPLRMRNFESQ